VIFAKTFRLLAVGFLGVLVFAANLFGQETKQIRFAVTSPPHFLPIWLAADNKIFSKYGLDVDVIYMRGGALITMGIISGELQISGVGAESVVAAKAEGGDVALLACPLDLDYVYLITRPEIKNAAQGDRCQPSGIDNAFLYTRGVQTARNGCRQRAHDPSARRRA
jgi:ABC-type nitrate/sulfonate/bicarbonate transport system substrate-binding protein